MRSLRGDRSPGDGRARRGRGRWREAAPGRPPPPRRGARNGLTTGWDGRPGRFPTGCSEDGLRRRQRGVCRRPGPNERTIRRKGPDPPAANCATRDCTREPGGNPVRSSLNHPLDGPATGPAERGRRCYPVSPEGSKYSPAGCHRSAVTTEDTAASGISEESEPVIRVTGPGHSYIHFGWSFASISETSTLRIMNSEFTARNCVVV